MKKVKNVYVVKENHDDEPGPNYNLIYELEDGSLFRHCRGDNIHTCFKTSMGELKAYEVFADK